MKNGRREEKGKPHSDVEGGVIRKRSSNPPKKYGQEPSGKKKLKLSVESRGLQRITTENFALAQNSEDEDESDDEDVDAESSLQLSELN